MEGCFAMEEKRNFFYGWWIVVASFFFMFSGLGILINTYGVLFSGILADTGFDRGPLGLYFTLMSLAMMFAFPIVGKIFVKYNTQVVLTVCLIVAGLAFMSFSLCSQLWHFYIVAIILGAFGAACSTLPTSVFCTNWFVEKRGLAIGLAMTGSGVGGMVCNALAQYVISTYSWQMAFIALGVVFLATTLPFALFVVKLHPSMKGLRPLGETGDTAAVTVPSLSGLTSVEVLKNPVFWLLGLLLFFGNGIQIAVQNNIPIFMQDLGHTAAFGATVISVYMGLLVLAKMLLGSILDKFGPKFGITFCLVAFIIACFLFINAKPMIIVGLFTLVFALAVPYTTVYPSYVISHLFGNLDYGTIYGFMNIFMTLGLAFAMPVSGAFFDATGTMVPIWYAFMGIAVVVLAIYYIILGRQPQLKETWHS
jgi:sugar phosphate permease